VKTARFSNVVRECGEPSSHLVFLDPAKDAALQSAIKANRVMTVFQDAAGTRADRGVVGFEPGRQRQYLVFPMPLNAFAGTTIVGINYDLLKVVEPPDPPQPRHPAQKPTPPEKRKAEVTPVPVRAVRPASAGTSSVSSVGDAEPRSPARQTKAGTRKLKPAKPAHTKAPPANVVPFEPVKEVPPEDQDSEEVREIKRCIRRAMDLLEQGKPVAAFNLLKEIVEAN
jgi:hypothetical protein